MKDKKHKCKCHEEECTCEDECTCTEEENCGCKDNCECECDCGCDSNDEIKALQDKYMRLQAEFVNFRVRTESEVSNYLKYEGAGIIKELLSVTDNFERAIKMDNNDLSDEVSKFLEGFKLIYTSIRKILDDNGVKEIEVLGREFDPTTSEAVMVEHDENKPEGVVLEVLTKGYMYKDKLLRPAMVKVNK